VFEWTSMETGQLHIDFALKYKIKFS
jgi:hypothetical protein